MFSTLRTEIIDRFTAVEAHFRQSPRTPTQVAQMSRGLVFVEVYAIWEHTIRAATNTAVATIAGSGHRFFDLRPSLLALYLDPQLESIRTCSPDRVWEKRLALFEQYFSRSPLPNVTRVPHDGSHFRFSQVEMIFRTLGIDRAITVRRRHPQMIDEIVNHRNSIAHGHESPDAIGRRYTYGEVHNRITLMRSICLRLILVADEYCSTPIRHRRRR